MTYVKITHDNRDYYLMKQSNDQWLFTDRTTDVDGNAPMDINLVANNGSISTIETNDTELLHSITMLVQHKQSHRGEQMINCYPEAVKKLLEMQLLIQATGFEMDIFKCEIDLAFKDAYVTTMGEARIREWEQAFGITPNPTDSISDRRERIVARYRGGFKLNTASIELIVKSFTGGTCKSYIEDCCLYVKIQPPPNNKEYKFSNVEAELARRCPAHLRYHVVRDYATWSEIRNDFKTWGNVATKTWEDLALYDSPNT